MSDFKKIMQSHIFFAQSSSTFPRVISRRKMYPYRKISTWFKNINKKLESQPRKKASPRELTTECVSPPRLDLLLDMPVAEQEIQLEHAWNEDDCSVNIFLKASDKLTFYRYPVAQTTDCIRGRVGYTNGLHVWEIVWPTSMRGTNAVVGVGTEDAPLQADGYVSLVGSNAESWGWDICTNRLFPGIRNNLSQPYPSMLNHEKFHVPDKMKVILDMDEGTLAFMVNECYLGIAFHNLKGLKLYPMVSAVWGRCEVTLKYIGGLDPAPLSLKDMCRWVIRENLDHGHLVESIDKLNLPLPVKNYLLYKK